MAGVNTNTSIDVTDGKRHELTIDWSTVERDPQARRRVQQLFEIAFSILKREGLLGKGLTAAQVIEALERKNKGVEMEQEIEPSARPNRIGPADGINSQQPPKKEMRIRLPREDWEQIGEEACRLRVTPNIACPHLDIRRYQQAYELGGD